MIGIGIRTNQRKRGGWSEKSISGCEFLYDASNSGSITLSGSDVTQLNDLSGNSRNLTPGTNSPSWASDTITFDKTNSENLRSAAFATMTQPFTIVLVYQKLVARDIAEYMIGARGLVAGLVGTSTSGTGNFVAHSGTALNIGNNDITTVHLHIVVFNGASTKYYLDDAAAVEGNAGANDMDGVELGSFNNGAVFSNFALNEAIGYSAAISDADRLLLKTFLQTKWGL